MSYVWPQRYKASFYAWPQCYRAFPEQPVAEEAQPSTCRVKLPVQHQRALKIEINSIAGRRSTRGPPAREPPRHHKIIPRAYKQSGRHLSNLDSIRTAESVLRAGQTGQAGDSPPITPRPYRGGMGTTPSVECGLMKPDINAIFVIIV